tara:strand:- start:1293 stop:1871 length:579 start_codon:yes stop_codon:yes gene_type:complete
LFLIDNFKNLLSPEYAGDLIYFLVTFILLWKITKEDMQRNIIPNKNIIFGLIFGIVTIAWLPQLKPIMLNQRFIDLTSLPFIKILDSFIAALFLGIFFIMIQLTPKVRLGAGDIKFSILVGFLLGFYWSFIALVVVSILLALYSIIIIFNKGKKQAYRDVYPLAPFWFLGSIFAVIFGNIISNYLGITLITG